jgi:hypothetical protein
MNWDCTDTEERLSDFLEGALSVEEAAAFNEHEAGCARCKQLVAQVGGLVRRMQRTEAVEAPERLVANILDATLGPRKTQRGWEWWLGWAQAMWQPRFAMGALTVAASFAIMFRAAGVTPSTISQIDLNPVNVARSANRQAHLTYGRAVKFVDDLQLVYEIRSQLEPEAQPQAAPPAEPSTEPSPESRPGDGTQSQPAPTAQPKSEINPAPGGERSREEMRSGRLLAFGNLDGATSFSANWFSVKGSIR